MPETLSTDLSLLEVQRRLGLLGYDLGDEAKTGIYGERTATALRAFKLRTHLSQSDVLGQATWAALVDASRTLGERPLYLHMPYFVGHDVYVLQSALLTMGFYCNVDWAFDPLTERALREFQRNLALRDDGIADDATFQAIIRLRHVWEGKAGSVGGMRRLKPVRAVEVLESVALCVFGTNATTRSIADRISNLAQATTQGARVLSASSLGKPPDASMVLAGLKLVEEDAAATATSRVADGDVLAGAAGAAGGDVAAGATDVALSVDATGADAADGKVMAGSA
ncbi:MAG: peptidoglycan-binding protein, partial [Coriobacteriales bacterium]|nr:peptidoglycan-binding protein [Coriobacteriales bacterium]